MRARTAFTLALIVVGLAALLEAGPRYIKYYVGASPLNTDWDGTSHLLEVLEAMGYDGVYVVKAWGELPDSAPKGERALIIIISPEDYYGYSDVVGMVSLISSFREVTILVADEGLTSNYLLQYLGIPVRVSGAPLSLTDPYPIVTLSTPSGLKYGLRLDHPSYLIMSEARGTEVEIMGLDPLSKRIVAATGELSVEGLELKYYVISDGSIFLNQVIEINETDNVYVDFIVNLLEEIAPPEETVVFIEASKYRYATPTEILERTEVTDLSLPALASIAAVLLHPSTWFPAFSNAVVGIEKSVVMPSLRTPFLFILAFLIFSTLLYYMLKKSSGVELVIDDRTLPKVTETYVIFDTQVRANVLREGKLGRKDFIDLYEVFREAVMKSVGIDISTGLGAGELSKLLNLSPEEVRRFLKELNKYYLKARGKRLLPIVLSWDRKTREFLRKIEWYLNKLGTSLEEGRGVEYVIRRF